MEKEWYVVNTYSGHENKVKEKLEMRASSMGMEDYIYRVVVPSQKEIVVKNGKEVEKDSKMFPGYILVEMINEFLEFLKIKVFEISHYNFGEMGPHDWNHTIWEISMIK